MTMVVWIGALVLLFAGAEFSKTNNQFSWVCNIAGIMLFILWIAMKEFKRRNPKG